MERRMRHELIVGTWPGQAAIIGLALLTLAIGFCLFDGGEHGLLRHAHSPDLCTVLALFAIAGAVMGLSPSRESPLTSARLVYVTSLRRLIPPPRPRSLP
jgi:hypothetical protein